MQKSVVLDASALIAFICQEDGAIMVDKYLSNSRISTVNLSEVAAFLIRQGIPESEAIDLLQDLSLHIVDYDESQALLAARLIKQTAAKGLSLGDRSCLALAMQHELQVLTADRAWTALHLPIKIKLIR